MGRPAPSVLFAQTFLHPGIGEHVDEVRFAEPVLISACEVLQMHTSSSCSSLSLAGGSNPQSFAVEIFVRTGGEARFKRLCPAFVYSPSTSVSLDVQAAVTDHMVVRGYYQTLTLVVFGNPVKDLGKLNGTSDLNAAFRDSIAASEVPCESEDLPEALRSQKLYSTMWSKPLCSLRLAYKSPEVLMAVKDLISLASKVEISQLLGAPIGYKVKNILVSAALAVRSADSLFLHLGIIANGGRGSYSDIFSRQGQDQNLKLLAEAREKLQDVIDQLQEKDNQGQDRLHVENFELHEHGNAANKFTSSRLVDLSFKWIEAGIQPTFEFTKVHNLLGALAAIRLLCIDIHGCFQFVVAGGVNYLMNLLQRVSGDAPIVTLLALEAIECVTRYAFGSDALLGWWKPTKLSSGKITDAPSSGSIGYAVLLQLLLQPQQKATSRLSAQILHRLRAYELAAKFQCTIDELMENTAADPSDIKARGILKAANGSLRQILKIASFKDVLDEEWLSSHALRILATESCEHTTRPLLHAMWAASFSKHFSSDTDMDAYFLMLLQQRRFLPSIAALLSSPIIRAASGKGLSLRVQFVAIVQRLILSLLSCRSGLLFLTSEPEATVSIMMGLCGVQEMQDKDLVPLRHAAAFQSFEYVCSSEDIGGLLQSSLFVMNSIDRLLSSPRGSEAALWSLWDLVRGSRTGSGKQAILAISHFPEVFSVVMETLELGSSKQTMEEDNQMKYSVSHFAAEVLYCILSDSAMSSLSTWIPYAVHLQRILLSLSLKSAEETLSGEVSGEKYPLCSRLLELVDPGVIYQKKGALGLLKYCAAIISGNTQQTTTGLPLNEIMNPDNIIDTTGTIDISDVQNLVGKGAGIGGSLSLSDTGINQLTMAMHILASVSTFPSVSGALYGEGALLVLYAILEYCTIRLQLAEEMVDEESDPDASFDELTEQSNERLFIKLLVPTLILLSALLQRLQLEVQEYCNTKLVDMLLRLHRAISAKASTHATVPPFSWNGGVVELGSVRQLLASVLACWPIFNWTPALLPKILGISISNNANASNVLPIGPVEACSMLCVLGDMLPMESSYLGSGKRTSFDAYRSSAVESLLGIQSLSHVFWHTTTKHSEKLFRSLLPHLDQLGHIVLQLASTTCAALREMLKRIIVRFAGKNESYAATILHPLLISIRETMSGDSAISDVNIFQVTQYLQFISELAANPVSKSMLLKEGLVNLLNLVLHKTVLSTEDGENMCDADMFSGIGIQVLRSFTFLCDPDVCRFPGLSLKRRLVEDCPKFEECCSIAASILSVLQAVPFTKDCDVLVEAFEKIGSHKLGRAAFLHVSLGFSSSKVATSSEDAQPENVKEIETEKKCNEAQEGSCIPPLYTFWKRLAAALETDTEKNESTLILGIAMQVAIAAIKIAYAGRSLLGMGALKLLLGLELKCLEAVDEAEPKIHPVKQLINWVEGALNEGDKDSERLRTSSHVVFQQAHSALLSMMAMLKDSVVTDDDLDGKIQAVLGDLINSKQAVSQQGHFVHLVPIIMPIAKPEPEMDLDVNNFDGSWESNMENTFGELKEKFMWECSVILPETTATFSKRKSAGPLDGNKRHRADGSLGIAGDGSALRMGSLSASTNVSNRRDAFRQRKPNTSRPPSMHVDDYVARERNNDIPVAGTSNAVPNMSQRNISGSGRPPSIHVDEFMARQRERQQSSSQQPQQLKSVPSVESLVNAESIECSQSNRAVVKIGRNPDTREQQGDQDMIKLDVPAIPAERLRAGAGTSQQGGDIEYKRTSHLRQSRHGGDATRGSNSALKDIDDSAVPIPPPTRITTLSIASNRLFDPPLPANEQKRVSSPHLTDLSNYSSQIGAVHLSSGGQLVKSMPHLSSDLNALSSSEIGYSSVQLKEQSASGSGSSAREQRPSYSSAFSAELHDSPANASGPFPGRDRPPFQSEAGRESILGNVPTQSSGWSSAESYARRSDYPPLPPASLSGAPLVPGGNILSNSQLPAELLSSRLLMQASGAPRPANAVSYEDGRLPLFPPLPPGSSSQMSGIQASLQASHHPAVLSPSPPNAHFLGNVTLEKRADMERGGSSAYPMLGQPPVPQSPSAPFVPPVPAGRPAVVLGSLPSNISAQQLQSHQLQQLQPQLPPQVQSHHIAQQQALQIQPQQQFVQQQQMPDQIQQKLHQQNLQQLQASLTPRDQFQLQNVFQHQQNMTQQHHLLSQQLQQQLQLQQQQLQVQQQQQHQQHLYQQQQLVMPQMQIQQSQPQPPPPPPPPPPPSVHQLQIQQQKQVLQEENSQQQESSNSLQKMLASPDAIQALLKDQNKLRQLLEQHPKLISLLQEKFNSS